MDSLKQTLLDRRAQFASLQDELETVVPVLNQNPNAEQTGSSLVEKVDDVADYHMRKRRSLPATYKSWNGNEEREEEVGCLATNRI